MEIDKIYYLDTLVITNRFNKCLSYNSKIWTVTYRDAKGNSKSAPLTVDKFFKVLRKYHRSIYGDFTKSTIHIETESR